MKYLIPHLVSAEIQLGNSLVSRQSFVRAFKCLLDYALVVLSVHVVCCCCCCCCCYCYCYATNMNVNEVNSIVRSFTF